MLKLSHKQIDAIRLSEELSSSVAAGLSDRALAAKAAAELSDNDYDELHDACVDALTNDAPVVKEFTAEQDKGSYSVVIQGIPGAYIVRAPEYDDEGAFSSLGKARLWVSRNFGEFI